MSQVRYLYGRHPVGEVLRAQPRDVHKLFVIDGKADRIDDMLRLASQHGIPVERVQRRALLGLVGDVPHQGIVAAVAAFAYADLDDVLAEVQSQQKVPLLLGLDHIQDPHNLGSLARSAYALGAHALFMPKDHSCEVTPVVVKASAGATAHLPVAKVTNMRRTLEELKQAGLWIFGAAATEDGPTVAEVDLRQPSAIVIGSEGEGLRRLVAETCDTLVRIPMAGELDSLNASVAGAIFLYEAARQRQGGDAGRH